MQKLVSVIINCHNSEKYLEETLKSVVTQTYKKWELIFYDNKSTDNSFKIFKSFKEKRFRYFKSKRFKKLGEARKDALLKARGDYIAFLDADDIWKKNKLKIQLNYFNNENIGFTISNSVFFNKNNEKNFYPDKKKFNKNVFYDLIENYFISFDTVIIKTSKLNELNKKLNKKFNIIHDLDLIIRLSKICEMNYVPQTLSKWRMRKDSLSYNSFKNIIKEKKKFITSLSRSLKNDKKFLMSRKLFLDTLYRQEILHLISQKKYMKIAKIAKKLKLNIKNVLLLIIIFLPFKKYIFDKFFNLKY